jgi:hypothetical protein
MCSGDKEEDGDDARSKYQGSPKGEHDGQLTADPWTRCSRRGDDLAKSSVSFVLAGRVLRTRRWVGGTRTLIITLSFSSKSCQPGETPCAKKAERTGVFEKADRFAFGGKITDGPRLMAVLKP